MYEMKESGIEWIGQIPKHWVVKKNKYVLKSVYSGGTPLTSVADFYSDNEGINFVTIADMSNTEFVESTIKLITEKGCAQKKLKILKKGTILFSIYATIGAVAELKIPATINQAILALEPYNIYKEYYKYNLKAMNKYLLIFVSTNTQGNLNLEKVLNLFIIFPPLDEQKKIADFLDNKVTEIDNLINDTKKLIDKYKEYKQSLITETVTKGLHSNVEMKDSGIEWIGQIPKHWGVSKLKYILDKPLQYGANETGVLYDETLPRYIRITDITKDNQLKKDDMLSLPNNISIPFILKHGDILFARSGATVGKTFLYKQEYGKSAFAGYLIKARINKRKALYKYIYLYTLSKSYEIWKNRIFIQSTIQNIAADKYRELNIPLPPINEQEDIANYLDDKCSQIDSIIEEKQSLIEKLEEYKKSLIYEYVTGKKQVENE